MVYVDSHCHLEMLTEQPGGLDAVVAEAHQSGVAHILNIAIDKASCERVKAIADRYDHVSASVGIHPNEELSEQFSAEELVEQASHPKVIAIGETGLDYFRCNGDLEWQRERFRIHIQAAKQAQKPLIVHTREARKDTMHILEQEKAEQVGGIIHCFTENWETAKQALDLGFYISLSGIVTFKTASDLQKVAKRLPLDRILIETDAPFLAPVPHRGKINKPVFVTLVAEFLATIRNDNVANIAQQTTQNFYQLFPQAVDF